MFSGAMPACLAAGILKAMEIAEREPQRRVQVLRHSDYLAFALEDAGFRVLGGGTRSCPF